MGRRRRASMPALLNRLALCMTGALAVAALLVGCGGGSSPTSAGGGVVVTPSSEIVAESDTKEANAPPITKTLVREWPPRWCDIKMGDTREEVVLAMGAYPTEQNSHKIPLIAPMKNGKINSPPEAAGSDTWEAPGSYQFNAFYDTNLRVQQLDFEGPARLLSCPAIRVG
jgi:hypothetical protein